MNYLFGGVSAIAGAILAGLFTYGAMRIEQEIVVAGAVRATRDQGIVTCNARVGEIERVQANAISAAVSAAQAAAASVGNGTETPEQIKELCKRSASCRSRGSL